MPTDEYFLKLLDAIRKAAGTKMMVTVEDLPEVVERLRVNAERYEKLNNMETWQLVEICRDKAFYGMSFDESLGKIKED